MLAQRLARAALPAARNAIVMPRSVVSQQRLRSAAAAPAASSRFCSVLAPLGLRAVELAASVVCQVCSSASAAAPVSSRSTSEAVSSCVAPRSSRAISAASELPVQLRGNRRYSSSLSRALEPFGAGSPARLCSLRRCALPSSPSRVSSCRACASQRGDLGRIGPAQHVAAAVIERWRSSFSWRSPGALICPARVMARVSRRNCSPVCAAGDVEAVRQLAFQPVVERRIGLDRELAHQRVADAGRAVRRGGLGAPGNRPDGRADGCDPPSPATSGSGLPAPAATGRSCATGARPPLPSPAPPRAPGSVRRRRACQLRPDPARCTGLRACGPARRGYCCAGPSGCRSRP